MMVRMGDSGRVEDKLCGSKGYQGYKRLEYR